VSPFLRRVLELPELRGRDLDDPGTTDIRLGIIRRKRFLRRLYVEWYGLVREAALTAPPGTHLEIGSGGGFLKEVLPGVVTSEVRRMGEIDLVASAHALPFGSLSLSGIHLVDVLHHIPRPVLFFAEAARCLRPGGVIVLIEPWNTPWAAFVWRHFHHEPFDPLGPWELPPGGPLSAANSALPWILFGRDRARFEATFPELCVLETRAFMPVSYLVSGGVSLRSMAPGLAYAPLRFAEWTLGPLNRRLGMFAFLLLRKDPGHTEGTAVGSHP
jgi:SAM-dependent methyltransferase